MAVAGSVCGGVSVGVIAASVRVLTSRDVKLEIHSYAHAHAHVRTNINQPATVSLDFIAYSGDYGHESALKTASPHSFVKTNRLVEPIKDTGEDNLFLTHAIVCTHGAIESQAFAHPWT